MEAVDLAGTRHNHVEINGRLLQLRDVLDVSRCGAEVSLQQVSLSKVKQSRRFLEDLMAKGQVIYGINTGFGKFSEVIISKNELVTLQKNLLASHAVAVGEPFEEEIVRAIMLLRANTLAKGYSGVRPVLIHLLLDMLNRGVHPVIPCQGSLGASGDLAPLAHMALVMTGKGEAFYQGKRMEGRDALAAAKLTPLELREKEGLALLNGTQAMTAVASLAVWDALNLLRCADIIAALSLEALYAKPDSFDLRLYDVRPYPGHRLTAENVNRLTQGSRCIGQKKIVQDGYSLRCIPQVHGASKDAVQYVRNIVEIELNSATDNPLVFADSGGVISSGNFHGQPVAQAMDFLCMAVAELGSISERRLERLLNPALNGGYPAFLVKNGGLNSGYMIAQYTAGSLASENKILSHPASVDSVSCSGSQEDHVSMGTTAARKARRVVRNVKYILAAELLAAAQAVEFAEGSLGRGTQAAYELLRDRVPPFDEDRDLYKDMEKAASLIFEGELAGEIEKIFPVAPR